MNGEINAHSASDSTRVRDMPPLCTRDHAGIWETRPRVEVVALPRLRQLLRPTVALHRSCMIAAQTGRPLEILTLGHTVDYEALTREMRSDGQFTDLVRFRNMSTDLATMHPEQPRPSTSDYEAKGKILDAYLEIHDTAGRTRRRLPAPAAQCGPARRVGGFEAYPTAHGSLSLKKVTPPRPGEP